MKLPKQINETRDSFPEVQEIIQNLQNFSSLTKTKYFLSNFTNITEKIRQLHQSGIKTCEIDKLEHFLLNDIQYETLNDIKNTGNAGI